MKFQKIETVALNAALVVIGLAAAGAGALGLLAQKEIDDAMKKEMSAIADIKETTKEVE